MKDAYALHEVMNVNIRSFLLRQTFFPGWSGLFLNPFYFARRGLVDAMRDSSKSLHGCLLDVGCGTKPYQSLFNVESYIGLDLDCPASRSRGIADYFYDGHQFPFDDQSFDAILCNQVLEHVFNPDEFLAEIHRVMRPGAKMLLTVPFVWDEHEQPHDFARYTSYGLVSILEKSKFRVLFHKKLGADASVFFQLVNGYLYKLSINWNRYVRQFFTVFVIGPINLIGLAAKIVLPRNPDLFLDHVVLIERL